MKTPLFLSLLCVALIACSSGFVAPFQQRQQISILIPQYASRRDFLVTSALASAAPSAAVATTHQTPQPLVVLPMVRIQLPKNGFGREYIAMPLYIHGQGPYEFMLDTGLTTEFITPHLDTEVCNNSRTKPESLRSFSVQGIAAAGTSTQRLVDLKGVSLCCKRDGGKLLVPDLHAIVTDFPQEHLDPNHDPIEGMLGMEFLSMFDVDLDFPKNKIRLYEQGTLPCPKGMVEIPATVINETGLLAIRVTKPGLEQPVIALLDCGSAFSVVNWAATPFLGMSSEKKDYRNFPAIQGIGVDGKTIQLPVSPKQAFTFVGDPRFDQGRIVGFQESPVDWTPWEPVNVAVGDLPAFSNVLGDGITPYRGPAVLIGLDVLSQRRIVLKGSETRRRQIFITKEST